MYLRLFVLFINLFNIFDINYTFSFFETTEA